MLIACTDNFKGFSKAIQSIYPKAEVQSCIMHQIRNVASKDAKEFMRDLKGVCRTDTKALAEVVALDELASTWESKYPIVIQSWQHNWEKLITYFPCTVPIRKLNLYHQRGGRLSPKDPQGH